MSYRGFEANDRDKECKRAIFFHALSPHRVPMRQHKQQCVCVPLCKHNYMANKLCSTHGQLFLYSIDLILYKTYNYVQKSQCVLSVCIVCLRYSTLLNIHTEFGFGFASSKSGVCGTCTMPPIIGNNNYHNEIELSIYYRDRASVRAWSVQATRFTCKYQGGATDALPINALKQSSVSAL